mmetsp:Transcript_13538/g.47804  ORF Transcript_13538/g.47804 Transcript_13538/m.47804 type:complete len:428 (+) Transcript_13538:81-1364(+)
MPPKKEKAELPAKAEPKTKGEAKPKVQMQAGTVVLAVGLPEGWWAVEKTYGTGGMAGSTYTRYFCKQHSSICTIKKAIELWAQDEGKDPAKYLAEYDAKKKAEKDKAQEDRQAKGFVEGKKKQEAIEAFQNTYGKLDGATICALPGWKGESKYLPNSGQISVRYYAPDGSIYPLVNQVEALFGFKLLAGKVDEIPDIEAVRSSLTYDAKGKVVNVARREGVLDEFTVVKDKPEPKKRKFCVMVAEEQHYRETEYISVVKLLTDDAEARLQKLNVPEAEEVLEAAPKIQRLLVERGLTWAPQLLYVTGSRNLRTPGKKLLEATQGIYYDRAVPFNDRPCFQKVSLRDDKKLACTGHHVSWSNQLALWKIGQLSEAKAGFAVCRQDRPDPFQLDAVWQIFEPKVQDVESLGKGAHPGQGEGTDEGKESS